MSHRRRRQRRRVHHVGRDESGIARQGIGAGGVQLRQAEIEHLHRPVVGQFDIRRLEVAMDDPALVCRIERVGDLPRNRDHVARWQRTLRDALGQRGSVHELHRDRVVPVSLFDTVDLGDVRVIQRRKRLGLASEARDAIGIVLHEGREDLQRDVTLQLRIARTIHLTHSA